MQDIRTISIDDLARKIDEGKPFYFWNVLTNDYFTGELIPGSERVPLDRIGREVAARRLPKDADIVVYCSGVSCPQSKLAAEKLQTLGYRNTVAFEGGLQAWKEAGFRIERQQAA
jgi:rhodanese-related sulfurtransferase